MHVKQHVTYKVALAKAIDESILVTLQLLSTFFSNMISIWSRVLHTEHSWLMLAIKGNGVGL